MSYLSEVLADSPAFLYRLDELSGTVVADSSGNGQVGTYQGGPTLAGVPLITDGKSVTFTATSWAFNNVALLLASTGAFTVEAWFKRASAPAGNLQMFASDNATGPQRMFQLAVLGGIGGGTPDGSIDFFVVNNGGTGIDTISKVNYCDGNRHHAVGTYDGTVGPSLYIDGVLVAQPGGTVALSTGTSMGPVVGAGFNGSSFIQPFIGTLDEVAAYKSALSAGRVLAHYNAGIDPGRGAPLPILSGP